MNFITGEFTAITREEWIREIQLMRKYEPELSMEREAIKMKKYLFLSQALYEQEPRIVSAEVTFFEKWYFKLKRHYQNEIDGLYLAHAVDYKTEAIAKITQATYEAIEEIKNEDIFKDDNTGIKRSESLEEIIRFLSKEIYVYHGSEYCIPSRTEGYRMLGDALESRYQNDKEIMDLALEQWKESISLWDNIPITDADRLYINKIKKYEPTYEPEIKKSVKKHCYVATAVYGSYDCPQVWTLRRYRDNALASTWYGRLFIRTYYAVSPTFIKWFGKTNWFNKFWKKRLDKKVAKLKAKGYEDTPYQD